ncbi:MAG: FtsX-like permease family protein [Candidatus Hydrogenedentales bacterium]|jgi:putative ABC transport system permease protein
MLSLFRFALRGIHYHRRLHLGLVLGALIACAVFTGARIVGYSVDATLCDIATLRLGHVTHALDWNNRYFDLALEAALDSYVAEKAAIGQDAAFASALHLQALAESPPDSDLPVNRINKIHLYGIDENFNPLAASEDALPAPGPQEALLNKAAAQRLALTVGDSVILRIPKPTLIPAEAPLASGKKRDSIPIRLRVAGIVTDRQGGRFSLSAEQSMPFNIFVNREQLGILTGLTDKANLLLCSTTLTAEFLRRSLAAAWHPEQLGFRIHTLSSGLSQLESERLFIEDPIVQSALTEGTVQPILTYLVNHIDLGEKSVPYSFVTAGPVPEDTPDNTVWLNQWLAHKLNAKEGDSISLSWYSPLPSGAYEEHHAEAQIHRILPMDALAVERELAPIFPGLSDVNSCKDWSIGLPLEEELLADEENEIYWKDYGQTPKLLCNFTTGRNWWGNLYGSVTALRIVAPDAEPQTLLTALQSQVDPASLGLVFQSVHEDALQAVAHALDFGALFTGLSMFLIGAALLLLFMLHAHGLQQRSREMGTLLAAGWSLGRIRTWLLLESIPGCLIGALAGAGCGVLYARLLLFGLARFWPDSLAGTPVAYHSAPYTVLVQGVLISVLIIVILFLVGSLRAARRPIRELLQRDFSGIAGSSKTVDRVFFICGGIAFFAAAVAWGIAFSGTAIDLTPAFFISGMGLLIAILCAYGLFLGYWARRTTTKHFSSTRLLFRQLARRRSRSLGMATIIGSGFFMIQSVVSMQVAMTQNPERHDSGAGGFTVFAATTVPVTAKELGAAGLSPEQTVALREKDGDDAGCLNLNQAQQPRIYGVDPNAFIDRDAFTSAGEGRALWSLLDQDLEPGVYPALVGDADTALWGLQAVTDPQTGSEYVYRDSRGEDFRLRTVGKLPMRLSLFQGSLLLSEKNFVHLFPDENGYRTFLVESTQAEEKVSLLNRDPKKLGMEATLSMDRLAFFYAVERAYLAMFLVLGGLGMMLGAGGAAVMIIRNLTERRSEFALFLAMGFTPATIRRAAIIENMLLASTGLFIGSLASSLATIPLLWNSKQNANFTALAFVLTLILLSYLFSSYFVTVILLKRIPLSALRKE